jgi:hypothetical protein
LVVQAVPEPCAFGSRDTCLPHGRRYCRPAILGASRRGRPPRLSLSLKEFS